MATKMTGGTGRIVKSSQKTTSSGTKWYINLYVYYKVKERDPINRTTTLSLGMYVRCEDSATGGNLKSKSFSIGAWSDSAGSYLGTTTNKYTANLPNTYGEYWLLSDKDVTYTHDEFGMGTATIDWKWGVSSSWGGYSKPQGSFTVPLSPFPVYSLSINQGEGSTVSVDRTSSLGESVGEITDGTPLYYNDTLKISFGAEPNYAVDTHTVNSVEFASGNTTTVLSDIDIVSTATPLKSLINATDAMIGSTSMINVTRYNDSYTHTILYNLLGGDEPGRSGEVCEKSSDTVISWSVPQIFYSFIPNAKSAQCVLTLETFDDNDNSLGVDTCTIRISVDEESSRPQLTCSVVDGDPDIPQLTGDDTILVRYKSTAVCSVTATPNNYATIASIQINGENVAFERSGGAISVQKTFQKVSINSFVFTVTDSRGYIESRTITNSMIEYIPLTCNCVVSRPTPTGDETQISFSGNYYRGSFGAYTNTLSMRFRYIENTPSGTAAGWSEWVPITSSDYVFGNNTYKTQTPIVVDGSFDYRKPYRFQIQASDGANGIVLSSVSPEIAVKRGIPVYDWGESDFEFHVPVKFSDDLSDDPASPIEVGNGVIKVGNTTLNESQLISLLALIT